ncbi:SDR family NAD(P)-dependent oxidoreductase [Spirosoma rigui]|uniref:SDR family NAD(P)-dependent oxidoreductase n=1 Tax=Spirosoma rigui TaxID=564064 RepID=UPI0009AFA73F|nr:SDR family oxidoreductase [Spirosoma rigui]
MTTDIGKTALITGASSGIGRELATLFAKDGYNLVLVARSEDKLQDLAEKFKHQFGTPSITVIEKDLSKPEAPQEIYDEVTRQQITVNTLVNNAGFGEYGKFATETDLQKELNVIQVNLTSLVHLTKLFLKDMVQRNEGKILMLGSIASIMPNPLMAVYGATKSFIYSFSEALRNEVKDTDISITVLMPPATDTDFFNKAGATNTVAQQQARSMDPADVAKEGYNALLKGKDKAIAGLSTKMQAAAFRVLPDSVVSQAARSQMKSQAEAEAEKSTSVLALGIGIAALALAGIALAAAYKNTTPYDRLRYRYKAGRAYGSAKNAVKSVADSVNGAVSKAKAKAEHALV